MGYSPHGRGHRVMERLTTGDATFKSLMMAVGILTDERDGAKRRLRRLLAAMERDNLVVDYGTSYSAGANIAAALDDLRQGDEYTPTTPNLRVFFPKVAA